MFWMNAYILTVFLLLPPSSVQYYTPQSTQCQRKLNESDSWWQRFEVGLDKCEVLDEFNEECAVCTKGLAGRTSVNECAFIRLGWKYNILLPDKVQVCEMMNHCEMTYTMDYRSSNVGKPDKEKTNFVNLICGTEGKDGKREQRGVCKSVYGTYICECKAPYQGRDCNDLGPDGAYATGVQVLLETQVKVSQPMTIIIAVKDKGNDFKVRVNNSRLNGIITVTEPIVTDPTKVIDYCTHNTYLDKQCAKYLEGSTSIYSVNVRFPLLRDMESVYYYKTTEDEIGYPVGYYTNFIITATNTINGEEKESFFRTNYDRKYNIFVNYPRDIGCYNNTKIVNCKELQKQVNVYDASNEIVLYGDVPDTQIHVAVGSKRQKCYNIEDDTMKWKLSRLMPDGQFLNIDEHSAESAFEYVIEPYSFQNGMYMVEFMYTMLNELDEKRENFDQCFFTVVEAPLVAIISGGSGRYVDVDTVIILDGSKSHDPNVEEHNGKEGLNFKWSCIINQTGQPCLEDYLGHRVDSQDYIQLPPYVLIAQEYVIKLVVTKTGKAPAYASQFLSGGSKGNVQSIKLTCVNCLEGNIANPTDYIYLLVDVVLKPNAVISLPLNYTWKYSTHPAYPPVTPTDSIRVNESSQKLLKIEKNKLQPDNTYHFRVEFQGKKAEYAEIDIHIPILRNFTCTLTPDTGIVAVTNFTLNCSIAALLYEVYDKSTDDPDYFTGRMLFTGFENPKDNHFQLVNGKVVVYGYDKFKMIEDWVQEVKLTPFEGTLKEIDNMVLELENVDIHMQKHLHSASVIAGALKPGMNWSSINLLKNLISDVGTYEDQMDYLRYVKLVLSSLEFILVVISGLKNDDEFSLDVGEAKMCANIISVLASSLFNKVKEFEDEETLTEGILHQMIRSHLNVIEIVLTVKNTKVLSRPLHLVNPFVLYLVKEATYKLVDALYKLSSSLLWMQIQESSATEIVSVGSKIDQWAMVHHPDVLYNLRRENESIPFNFSIGFYKMIQNLHVFGIQVTNLNINPFWWSGNDITTNILLVEVCFKVNLTHCKHRQAFYKPPIYLYFNISKTYDSLKPLEIHTEHLDFAKDHRDLDLDVTVYRFDPPLRAKLFIQFEFENSTEDYKVLFSVNMRPDFEQISKRGVTINNQNQSTVKYLPYIKDDSDKLYYLGIYPGQPGHGGKRVKFKLKILYAVCKTWLRWKWGNQRCWVGEQETNEETLRCDCNHLSMFAGALKIPNYTLNPGLEYILFLTEEFNWLPLTVLIVILLVFTMLYIWGCIKDRKDSAKGIVTILEDNYPGESFAYLIGVYTGSRINSGTDANVGIRLLGENGETRAHILKHNKRAKLRGNCDDWFLLYSPAHLGTLESLHVWHDNSGKSPDWFIEQIEVYDLTDKLKYVFELNIWLAMGVNEYPEVFAVTCSMEDLCSVRRSFLSNVISGFRDTNYWTSIFWKHARNPVKRVLRISVVLCYVMVAMTCTILLYRFNKGEDYEEDEPSYKLDSTDLIIFTITFLVASFVASFVMFFFRKSYSHTYRHSESFMFLRPETASRTSSFYSIKSNETRSQTDISKNLYRLSVVSLYDSTKPQYIEISYKNLHERFIRLGVRRKQASERTMYEHLVAAVHAILSGNTLQPVRLPQYKSGEVLHKAYFFTGWLFFLIISLGSIAVVILFGHRIAQVESTKWLTIFLCTILFDALIVSTFKILLCSAILGCVFQRVVPESKYQVRAEDGMNRELFGDKKHLLRIAQIRNNPMYLPLSDNLKALYRERCIRREHTRTLLDFLVVLLLILILVMLHAIYTVNYYRSNTHVVWMLTQGPSVNYQSFADIYNRTLYRQFLFYNFIDQLHRYLWYNFEDLLNDDGYTSRNSWMYDCTMRLLGNARIRQVRVVLGECPEVGYFEDARESCSPPWSSGAEDTGVYSTRWGIGRNEPVRRKSRAWRYTGPADSNSSVTQGPTLTLYPSGGFIENLGFEKDETEHALSSLISQNWLDHMTRAVFIEFTVYNINTGLFTQVILVAEQMPTGQYFVAVKAESVNTDFTFDFWKFSFSMFFIFFLVRMCVLINRRGLFVYFSKTINVYEMFLLSLGFFTFTFYTIHVKSSSDYVNAFQNSGIDEFFNFLTVVSFSNRSRTALCVLFVCLILRMFISMRFGRIYFTFYYTLFLSFPWALWLVLYLVLYLIIIRRFISYILNVYIFPYRTIVMVYHMDPSSSGCKDLSCKALVYLMCFSSQVVILLFIASFAYYYKVAKVYKLIDTDRLNFFTVLTEMIRNICKNKKIKTCMDSIIEMISLAGK